MPGVFDRRCSSCAQTFTLPTLTSRQATCPACDRKAALAVMEARKCEVAPAGVRGFPIGARGVVSRIGDQCAEGVARPTPLTPSGSVWGEPGKPETFTTQTPGQRACLGVGLPHVVDEACPRGRAHLVGRTWRCHPDDLETFLRSDEMRRASYARLTAAAKPVEADPDVVDVTRDPLPPVPRTQEEAMALLQAGWWLQLGGHTRVMRYERGRVVSRRRRGEAWDVDRVTNWAWPYGRSDAEIERDAWFHPIRPEPDRG